MSKTGKTLLVRHLPEELNDEEKTDFLCHFGAQRVKLMGTKGPMKNTAFAMFDNPLSAEKGLKSLHQLDVLGCKLVVEYAKTEKDKEIEVTDSPSKKKDQDKHVPEDIKHVDTKHVRDGVNYKDKLFEKHGIPYPPKANLYYLYPPPTVSTLTNIANALASSPRFYTQVLHLMNKMHLPCPFGAVTASPPLALEAAVTSKEGIRLHGVDMYADEIEEFEMEQSSTEESEIESDPDVKKKKNNGSDSRPRKTLKRPRKRMRLVEPDTSVILKPALNITPGEIFEGTEGMKPSQIVFNLSSTDIQQEHGKNVDSKADAVSNVTVVEGGFGKVLPQAKQTEVKENLKEDVRYKIDPKMFVSKEKVNASRLKQDQMREFSVFRNYSAGEPSCRLYIKNLTKHTTEQDLVDLFGAYIDWSSDLALDSFDIRLMKEGRMKGQAFVTLPDEESAKTVVKECTGYVMNGKPIVIQFARSAKAKEVKELIK